MVGIWTALLLGPGLLAPEEVVVAPTDHGAALRNPAMGWVFHHYDNVLTNYGSKLAPADTVEEFPGARVVYLRLPWSELEPAEGEYVWSTLDTPAQRWIDKGWQIALRISCCESWCRWATPEWVQRAGAKGHNFRVGAGVVADGPFWEPDYDDPVFLEKLSNFLAALAARYDGNPEVAFVDVGSFGVWGEGHTFHSSKLPYTADTIRRHIALHRQHFRQTLIAVNDDFSSQGRGDEVVLETAAHGLTLRDDSILVQPPPHSWFHAGFAPGFWPRVPVILESEHFGPSQARGAWGDGSLYLQAVEEYHASYASVHWWPREFLAAQREWIDRINLRLGYRLNLVEARWPARLALGEALWCQLSWRNVGVAPCYPGGYPTITLKDAAGGIAAVWVGAGLNVRDLPVAAPGAAAAQTVAVGGRPPLFLAAGDYDVFVSVGNATGTAQLELPLAAGDGQRRYRVGRVRIHGAYTATATAPRRDGSVWSLPVRFEIEQPLPDGVAPFLHFEQDGRILWQGHLAADAPALASGFSGERVLPLTFTIPATAAGQTVEVFVGLWQPAKMGDPEERLRPTLGQLDRRVALGRWQVDAAGELRPPP
ncbi:MAG: DUF4832 domain-containing protein [Fimbriimonadaceae bacterium]|nr:DUF4832 domain-containing protein [Fimbriimonadaceae bacterium]